MEGTGGDWDKPEGEQAPEEGGQKAALITREQLGYIVPSSVEETMRLAKAVVMYGLAPDSYNRDAGKVMLGIMSAMEVGLPPLYGLRQIAIINGRPCVWGDAAQALIQRHGQMTGYSVEWTDVPGFDPNEADLTKWPDEYGVTVTMARKGQTAAYVGKFTVGDAKRAKLWLNARKVPWMEHPKRMLMVRARAFAQRDGFADALAGLSIREEVEDYAEPERHVEIDLNDVARIEAPPMVETETETPMEDAVVTVATEEGEGDAPLPV